MDGQHFMSHHKKDIRRLLNILSRQLSIVTRKEAGWWRYLLVFHYSSFDTSRMNYFESYSSKYYASQLCDSDIPNVKLEEEELAEVVPKFNQLKLGEEYVCIFARDSAYLTSNYSGVDKSRYAYRNSDIAVFGKLANYIQQKEGRKTIRVGQKQNKRYNHTNVIDLTNESYDELLDIYVNSKCALWIGGESGAAHLPRLFRRQVILVNITGLVMSAPTFSHSDGAIFLFKMYFSHKMNRYLSVYEMLCLNFFDNEVNNYEKKYDIELIENDEDDILCVYMEAKKRFANEWKEDNEGKELQRKYNNLKKQFLDVYGEYLYNVNYPWKIKDCIYSIPVATSFLKRHPYLVKEIESIFI